MLRLVRNVERLLGGGLHLGGQFVAGDAGLKIEFTGMSREMILVERLQQRELPRLRSTGQ